jgi:hypothetical protein
MTKFVTQVFSPQFKQQAKKNMMITVGFLMLMCVKKNIFFKKKEKRKDHHGHWLPYVYVRNNFCLCKKICLGEFFCLCNKE